MGIVINHEIRIPFKQPVYTSIMESKRFFFWWLRHQHDVVFLAGIPKEQRVNGLFWFLVKGGRDDINPPKGYTWIYLVFLAEKKTANWVIIYTTDPNLYKNQNNPLKVMLFFCQM